MKKGSVKSSIFQNRSYFIEDGSCRMPGLRQLLYKTLGIYISGNTDYSVTKLLVIWLPIEKHHAQELLTGRVACSFRLYKQNLLYCGLSCVLETNNRLITKSILYLCSRGTGPKPLYSITCKSARVVLAGYSYETKLGTKRALIHLKLFEMLKSRASLLRRCHEGERHLTNISCHRLSAYFPFICQVQTWR